MQTTTRAVSVSTLLATALFFAPSAFASTQASVKIEQVSAGAPGVWTLYTASGTVRTSKDKGVDPKNYSIGVSEFGQTTLSVTSPAGMSARIGVYRGGDLLVTTDTPQYSFSLYPNDNYRFSIQYALSRLGDLGITSEPSGIRFRMKGPTSKMYTAKTPFTFKNIPAGQYAVMLGSTAKCLQPATHSAIVAPEQRNTLHITLNCDKVVTQKVSSSRPSKRSLVEYAESRELKSRGDRK